MKQLHNIPIRIRAGGKLTSVDYLPLYNNQINAQALIDQLAMVYCACKPMEKSRVYYWDVGRTLAAAPDLRILFVFYQHPLWFISV